MQKISLQTWKKHSRGFKWKDNWEVVVDNSLNSETSMNSMTMPVNISEKKNKKKVKNFFLFFYFIVLLNRKSIDFIMKIGYDERKSVLK